MIPTIGKAAYANNGLLCITQKNQWNPIIIEITVPTPIEQRPEKRRSYGGNKMAVVRFVRLGKIPAAAKLPGFIPI
ncbi:hypothetical protein [Microbacter margulisiae]|uniref:Uncharacterized protein n=1 Tax=Microbacter margulisiae TaxID=1350067 RepID=A0A7W5H1C5_9PORP|nr:hypothetical protein [Microbacter margulisiae]MBB3187443.1 hypothetical protein [Microbacter margulisiae]